MAGVEVLRSAAQDRPAHRVALVDFADEEARASAAACSAARLSRARWMRRRSRTCATPRA